MPNQPPMFQIATHLMDQPVGGADTVILAAPPEIYATIDGSEALVMTRVGLYLRMRSEQAADRVNSTLHHADWVLTADPGLVRSQGLMHDCPTCRAGVDQALAYLAEFPDQELFVGILYFTAT